MKKIFLFTMLLQSSLVLLAQNGGQGSESSSTRLEYIGVTPSGNHMVRITNKQDCPVSFTVKDGSNVTNLSIPGLSSDTVFLPQNVCLVKVKPTTRCTQGGDLGQVELNVCNVLPLKFETLSAKRISRNEVQIRFKIVDLDDHKLYIQTSKDGVNFRRVGVEVPKTAKVGDIYIVNIKL